MEQKKICSKCKKEKTLEEFNKHKNGKFGRHHYCKECNSKQKKHRYRSDKEYRKNLKNIQYQKNYGITLEEAENMFLGQGRCCKICKKPLSFKSRKTHVDHCHDSGIVRGVLCSDCNTTLGKVGEDVEVLKTMIKYIETGGKLA